MKVVRFVRLWMKEGTSDKIYEVDLVDLERSQNSERYLVNFRYGRRGSTLRDGTKTPSPTAFDDAEKIFDSVVVSKINDGYRRMGEEAAPAPVPAPGDSAQATGRDGELLKQLAACLRSPWPEKERDRLFWRLGVIRLQAAYPQLAQMADKLGAPAASYSLVHALARCGGEQAVESLARIAEINISMVVRDYAAYALGSEWMGARRQPPRLGLPQAGNAESAHQIEVALAAADGPGLIQVLTVCGAEQPGFANQFLIALAHQAQARPVLRPALLAALRALAARPPFVQVLRRLFKYADLTDDGALFAATARQFELARPMYRTKSVYRDRVWVAGSRQPLKLSEEKVSATPRIALSDQTLLYFKRRAWRTLRKRAELGQDAYTAMATELLLAFTDADGNKPYKGTTYVYVDGGYRSTETSTDAFRRVWSVSHILHGLAPTSDFSANTLTHRHLGAVRLDIRGEAFPALWDAQPQRLLQIAASSRNLPAALFAVEALQQGPERPQALEAETIAGLIASPYLEVNALAVSIARRLIASGKADGTLVIALLGAGIQELQALGIEAIKARADWPWSDPALALAVMTSPHERIQGQAGQWLQERSPTQGERARVTEAFAAWLEKLPAELDAPQRMSMRFALSLLPILWPGDDCPLAPETIQSLTGHPSPDVQGAAIELLAVTPIRPEELPQPFWNAILQASAPEVRAASMRLLGRLDPASLASHTQTIVIAATSEHADLRAAARPLVIRLAAHDQGFADQLRDRLMAGFFRAEPSEGYAVDMVRLFVESLPHAFAAVDTGTLWRLLQAKAGGARLLGTKVLEASDASRLSVKQIARLGNHSFAAVRHWVLRVFAADEARFREEPEDAVLLVESEWDDVRMAATDRLLAWPSGALPVSALAVMADSTVPAVQESARQLLRRTLADEDAGAVLTRVLEHPSGSFHLFVTELITSQTLADPALFEKFLTQARVILMQIHRGRVAKDRVFSALRNEALARQDRAGAVRELLHDLTLSAVMRDKGPALTILRDIAQAWPDISTPLGLVQPRLAVAASRRSAA